MRRDWLNMRFGVDFAAIGLLALCIGIALIAFHDIWFIATGAAPAIWTFDKVLSYLAAAVAAVFAAASFFIFRPGLAKYVAVILAMSFASYLVQPLLPVHGYRAIKIISVARTIGFCSLLPLVRRYLFDLRGQRLVR